MCAHCAQPVTENIPNKIFDIAPVANIPNGILLLFELPNGVKMLSVVVIVVTVLASLVQGKRKLLVEKASSS